MDRKPVHRYVEAAEAVGVVASGDDSQLTDGVIGLVSLAVRPDRPRGHGGAWKGLEAHAELITGWVRDDLTLVKVHVLLSRRGVKVPYRTLHRFAVARRLWARPATVRVADGEPGFELQVDFGRMGLIADPVETVAGGWSTRLYFTACYSRHNFVFLAFRRADRVGVES